MKTLARKFVVVVTGTVLTMGVVGAASPAEAAKDTRWRQATFQKDTSLGHVGMMKRDTSW